MDAGLVVVRYRKKLVAVKLMVSVIVSAFAGLAAPVDASANAHANAPKVIFFMTPSQVVTPFEPSGDLPPPSPPAEKATARQDQAGQSSTNDGAGDGLARERKGRVKRWTRHRIGADDVGADPQPVRV